MADRDALVAAAPRDEQLDSTSEHRLSSVSITPEDYPWGHRSGWFGTNTWELSPVEVTGAAAHGIEGEASAVP